MFTILLFSLLSGIRHVLRRGQISFAVDTHWIKKSGTAPQPAHRSPVRQDSTAEIHKQYPTQSGFLSRISQMSKRQTWQVLDEQLKSQRYVRSDANY